MEMTRRQLIAAGPSSALFPAGALASIERASARAPEDPQEAARDERYWGEIRRGFPIEPEFVFLNHGGASQTSRRVQEAAFARMRTANRAPSYYLFRKQDRQIEEVRKRIAAFFGCDAEEIAVTPNASYGLQTVIMGLVAERGDAFAATTHEYPRTITALHQRERRDGVRLLQAQTPGVPTSVESLMTPVGEILKEGPKLLCVSRVSFLNGTLFPVKEIAKAASATGTRVLVDGAHGIGQLPENAADLGCDFYTCPLHKWVLGPIGTGFLYVRRDRIKEVWPLHPADAALDGDIRKFEQVGTHPTGISLAILEALDAHEAIGTARKGARLAYLREYWTRKLLDHPKIRFASSLHPELSRGLTTLEIEGIASPALADWLLRRRKLYVTTMAQGDVRGIRVTPNIFTSLPELDRLVAALLEAADHGIG